MSQRDPNKRLKIALIERGFVQQELANQIDMPRRTLNMIVNARINPNEGEKLAIAKGLGMKVEELFAE